MKNKVTVIEAAQILGVSTDTIRRWEKKGLLRAKRTKHNYREFDIQELTVLRDKISGNHEPEEHKILQSPRTRHNVIELFAGAGGMALGLSNAGFNTEMLVEIDEKAVDTLRTNRPDWNIVSSDVREIDFTNYVNKVDVVAGGFPCQAFSYAGLGMGFEDTRGTLFFEFARCVNEVKPKIALGENVRGLLKHDNGRTLMTMVKTLEELGYRVAYKVLRAQFHDVPQKRERLVILGIRNDLDYPMLFPKEREYTVSLAQALKDCPPSKGIEYSKHKYDILALIPPGGYWRDLPDNLQREYMGASYFSGGGKTGMARRLSFDEPSLTLTCSPAQKQTERCHPLETRPLNCREYARIQTFPDYWEFVGSAASQYRQIGNAVPVNLAYHIGRGLIAMLDGSEHISEFEVADESVVLQEKLL